MEATAILILKNARANTRFAPTSDAGFRVEEGANLVFARSWNDKIRITVEAMLRLIKKIQKVLQVFLNLNLNLNLAILKMRIAARRECDENCHT